MIQALIIFLINCPLNYLFWIAMRDEGSGSIASLLTIGGTLILNWGFFPNWFPYPGKNKISSILWISSFFIPFLPMIIYAFFFL
jgi:hypothetical protein